MSNYSYESESLMDTLRNNKKTAIGILAFIIALVLLFFVVPRISAPQGTAVETKEVLGLIKDYDIKRGNQNANVTVIFYEDPQCPGCQAFSKSESDKLMAYKDKVRFVYKYIQVIPSHTFSKEANTLIYAAEKIASKGYELAEAGYKGTSNPATLNRNEMLGYAKDLGIDNNALSAEALKPGVADAVAQAQKDFEFKIPKIDGYTKEAVRLSSTPGVIIIKNNQVARLSVGNATASLENPKENFTATDTAKFLEDITK
jgi:hypothetical protein